MSTRPARATIPDRLPARWSELLLRWEVLLLALLLLVVLINALVTPYFLDVYNLLDSTFVFSEKAIIALPMALLIIARDIDLSVAAIVAFASVLMGMAAEAGAGPLALVAVGLGVGAAAGLLNGLVVTRFGVPSIVVTIGTMSLFRGIAFVILGDQAYTTWPAGFDFFGQGYVLGYVPFSFALFLLLAVLAGLLLHATTVGRRLYAMGNNPVAARYSGIEVDRYRLWLMVGTGTAAGLAAILLTSRVGSSRPQIAMGWELEIVTMVVLGGVQIMGGAGTVVGVVLAVFVLGLVTFGLGLHNIPGIAVNIVIGAMLILSIALPVLLRRMLQRR
ncbi:MAG TPA: ABC transporter permease [Geminicoccaceae bacterium]|nr:ABC transporter permease [Geminicoccaceae bacterium]